MVFLIRKWFILISWNLVKIELVRTVCKFFSLVVFDLRISQGYKIIYYLVSFSFIYILYSEYAYESM